MDPHEAKIYLAFLIAAAVLAVILIYFIVTILRQQRNHLTLHQAKIQAEIIMLEKERARIARDLHDELAPVLLAVKYNINSFDVKEEEDLRVLDKTNDILNGVIRQVRTISNDLLPDSLLRTGLLKTIEDSASQAFSQSHIRVEFNHDVVPSLPLEKSVHIFRIVQEIIHNTVKHAKARKLIIKLTKQGSSLFLETEDDGCGFNYSSESKEFTGLGLRSMLSRADILEGRMYLDSKAGSGTRYTFEIPV